MLSARSIVMICNVGDSAANPCLRVLCDVLSRPSLWSVELGGHEEGIEVLSRAHRHTVTEDNQRAVYKLYGTKAIHELLKY